MEQNPDSKTTTSPPPHQQEPEPKKPKMSTTTSDDDNEAAAKKQRYKRRKIAIFFAYCGVGYQGMQKNPGAKTIEGDLEEALYHAGGVSENDRGKPVRYDWARSARTDKGVSAVGQVVSGRFYIDPPGFVDRLNSILPDQIRIFGFKRVTASFNAKKFCDRRRYVYLIPVFALDPCSHRDRESVLASLGSGNELVKCLECSDRGRKVVGVVGKRSFELKVAVSESGVLTNDKNAIVESEIKEGVSVAVDNGNGDNINYESAKQTEAFQNKVNETKPLIPQSGNPLSNGDAFANPDGATEVSMDNGNASLQLEATKQELNAVVEEEKVNGGEKGLRGSAFCYGEKEKERFNRMLKQYVGSHNFHNFTTRTKADDPSARRYIVSFDATNVVTVEGIDFVKCVVVGQSFMLHQIRKMMGLAVAIMRNCAPESLIETALQKDVNINVPTAPEVGLYLDECLFASYNQKWKDSHEELSMKAFEEEAEDFKMKYIYSHIASTEHKEGTVALWLHSLNHRNYPDLRFTNGDNINGKESAKAEDMVE